MQTTLLIMAAGIGSRFGTGIKQLEPVDDANHIIMDYSIHDAIEAGFNHVVFSIRKDIEKEFKEVIGDRIASICSAHNVTVDYAFQDINDIPGELPAGRTKPWGTGQAVLAAKDVIKTPFIVINADDYYGKEGFKAVHEYLVNGGKSCMAGFVLKNTLSDNGGVTRGICKINNNVDSANPTENDFTPFLNIMNEWYAKDTSNKIKAVFKSRMKEGLRCSGAIPYGYKRINGDKQTLVVDEPAAEIVRKVFRLACQGMGVTAIAEQLTEEKVLIPSAYTAKYFPENCRNRSFSDPYRWNANTIGHILDRQEYLGHTVLGKSICENFKTKQRRAATPEELMIFPDTHEAIIDQDTWDIAQKLRVRAKPRAANGTYSHRLSGMIYCADCGSRMGFISPEARQSGKHYDSDSAFQCGNYRNQNNECVSHFIKTSALEAAILQAIKAVSQYVIENEAEFISQLKTVWNESKSKSANNGQQEIDEAKKRMAELDAKIQKLYDSAISGLLPERQAQRMIQQYDEEQLMLEKRVEELQGQIQEEEVEKIDTNRFIALVNKYRNCEELTDTMLYAFIDRVEVHEATGGRTVYRQQNIDIYFNFIGNYYPPVETVSEEERIAAIEAEQLRKKQEKAKRAAEVQKQKKAALMKAVEAGDPEAIAEYERKLALQRERNHRRQQKIKEAREADPAYIAQMEEKERLQREKLLEAERKRTERANRQKKLSRKELKEAAKTDPKAAEEWQALKEKEAVARQRKKEREEERMAADPEYAAMMAERKAEYTRTRTAKRQAEREALVELAKTDEEAAKKLAEMRKYQSQATVRSYQKMKADAEAGDPDAIKRYETTLAKRREEYHRKKGA